ARNRIFHLGFFGRQRPPLFEGGEPGLVGGPRKDFLGENRPGVAGHHFTTRLSTVEASGKGTGAFVTFVCLALRPRPAIKTPIASVLQPPNVVGRPPLSIITRASSSPPA